MKKTAIISLCAALLGWLVNPVRAAVVISNLDLGNVSFGFNAPVIGQALLTGDQAIALSSVQFLQDAGLTVGETLAVYSRNADGTVGSPLFSDFTLGTDPATNITTATVNGSFTLGLNAGYYLVLNSNSTGNLEWSYTSSTSYAAGFGASLPASGYNSFFLTGGTIAYRTLAQGPQEFQVNGAAAVPEPSDYWAALGGLGLLVVMRCRRRRAV